ncbi:PREDICTED: aminopeptidase N-like [Dinoponera quadriceps]|uniref:Aminopeptidase N n=1 Tax=Dinoponera quadriceps TaxID=609295 RepID=A0A6P3X195_DINQU|nr:PREDICTED: aminopeptidase N-like [Dinoponera quadriceps]
MVENLTILDAHLKYTLKNDEKNKNYDDGGEDNKGDDGNGKDGNDNSKPKTVNAKIQHPSNPNDFLILTFEEKIPGKSGPYKLVMKYNGTLNDNLRGFYRSSYNDSKTIQWLATTHFEPVGARLAFPCWDEPAIKATFDITIKNPEDYSAISNMNMKSGSGQVNKDTKIRTTEFEQTPIMSTYLVAFVVSKFQNKIHSKDTNFAVWTRPNVIDSAEYAVQYGRNVLDNLEEFTGYKYYKSKENDPSMNMAKMDQISIPQFAAGAMENWGLVTYRESALLYTANVTTTQAKHDIAKVISHEFSHQWFGNLVTPEWWNYIWLNEGFATFFQYFTTESVNEAEKEIPWRLMEQFVVKNLQESAFVSDGTIYTRKMNQDVGRNEDINKLFDNIAYKKAASVIRMMQHFMTEDYFKEGLQKYLKENHFTSVTPEKLFKAMNDTLGKKDAPVLPASVADIMATWVDQEGYPVVTVERNANNDDITLKQERFFLTRERPWEKAKKPLWYIPINYVTDDSIKSNDTSAKEWMDNKVEKDGNSTTLTIKGLKTKKWWIFNNLQTGYYRVNYDDTNWETLATLLNSDNYTHILPVSRAQLIDDSLNLARGGYLSYDVALQFTLYLEREIDYIPWYAAARSFDYMDRMLQNMENYDILQKYIVQRINKFVENVGLNDVPTNNTDILKISREFALTTACRYGHKACQKYADEQLKNWLEDENKVPTDMREGVLCAGLRHADQNTWNKTLNKYEGAAEDEKKMILNGLGCSQSNKILRIFLEESLKRDNMDIFKTLNAICMNNAGSFDIIINFLNENIDQILEKDNNREKMTAHLNNLSTRIINHEQYGQLVLFVLRHKDVLDNRNVNFNGMNKGRNNIDWIEESQDKVSKWLTDNYHENSATSFTAMTFLIGMTFLRLLFKIALTFVVATALPLDDDSGNDSQTAKVNYRLPDNVTPVHYNIKLIPHIVEDNFTFNGEINVDIVICRVTRDIRLHALQLTIDEDATSLVDSEGVVYTPREHDLRNVTQMLVLDFDDELPPGHYTLNIKFVGILNDDLEGFFRTSYQNEQNDTVWIAVTLFEATSARRAFPCWDEPALKATFNISIKHHRNYTALSNMPARVHSEGSDEDGMIWTHFDTTPVMSTYLVAFVVLYDYVRVPNADGTVNMWSRSQLAPHSAFAQQIAERSEKLLTQYTNSTDKVPKMDHVSSPDFLTGAMENWGLIIYTENDFTYNEAKDTTKHKHWVAVVVAHEMAHQWFSNVVSPLWWTYVWLNEGFASFFESYILNMMFEDWRMMDLFVVEKQHSAFHFDVAKQVMPVTAKVNSPDEIKSLFTLISYRKAPVILRMLQHIITDQVFRNGLIRYLNTHQFSSATSDDLWNALQAALDESDVPHNDYILKDVMDTWTTQRHYPVLHVIRNYDTGEVILKQEHFRPDMETDEKETIDGDKWWIPITFATQSSPDFFNTVPTHWLRPQDENITISGIDPNDWIIVNLQQMGYYLVNYDATNWKKISDYLQSDDYTKIHVLNRAQLINDAYHLLRANQLNLTTFLDIAAYLKKETEYIPWCAMFAIFNEVIGVFNIPGGEYLKESMFEMVNGLVENVGYEESPTEDDFTKLKRVEALKWACHFGHPQCRRMATAKLIEYLDDPEGRKIPPNLKEWTLCNGMSNASLPSWNKMRDMYIKTSDDAFLFYMACSEDPDIIIRYLKINDSLADDFTYDYTIYSGAVSKHANKDPIFNYILANLDQITSRGIKIQHALGDVINNVYSKEKLDQINEFVKNNYKEDKELLKYIEAKTNTRLIVLLNTYKFIKTVNGVS